MENKNNKQKAINDFLKDNTKKKRIKSKDGLIERFEHIYVDENGRQLLKD